MWKLIRAEWGYNRFKLAALYVATAGIWIIYFFDPSGMLQLFGIPALFLMMALCTRAAKQKRERWHALLPIPVERRGLASALSFAFLFYAIIASIWPLQLLFEPAALANEYITFQGMLVLNGLTVSAATIMGMRSDLKFHGNRKYRRRIDAALVVAGLAYLGFKIVSHQNPETYADIRDFFFYNPALTVFANAVAAGLIYWQAVIYAQRKSFLT